MTVSPTSWGTVGVITDAGGAASGTGGWRLLDELEFGVPEFAPESMNR